MNRTLSTLAAILLASGCIKDKQVSPVFQDKAPKKEIVPTPLYEQNQFFRDLEKKAPKAKPKKETPKEKKDKGKRLVPDRRVMIAEASQGKYHFGLNLNGYMEFSKSNPGELRYVLTHARRRNIDPALLIAIRKAENGREGREWGVIAGGKRYANDKGYMKDGKFHLYENSKDKQAAWAAAIVQKRLKEFEKKGYGDFISHMKKSYCPNGAANDPTGLNNHWKKNVTKFYERFEKTKRSRKR